MCVNCSRCIQEHCAVATQSREHFMPEPLLPPQKLVGATRSCSKMSNSRNSHLKGEKERAVHFMTALSLKYLRCLRDGDVSGQSGD